MPSTNINFEWIIKCINSLLQSRVTQSIVLYTVFLVVFCVCVLTGEQGNEIRKSDSIAMSVRENKKHCKKKVTTVKVDSIFFSKKRKKKNISNIVIESMVLH